jgi:sarcosine oxidase subunit alpha
VSRRLPAGGRIDRTRPVPFTWDGRSLSGFAGDTLASALLANDVRVVGRSFKYHRPRGIFSAGVEEPNAIVDLSWGERHDPNARATMVALESGMAARGLNGTPNVAHDLYGVLDLFHRFMPAGFYYKTFMRPKWGTWEPRVRAMAGLGMLRATPDPRHYETRSAHCDVLVVGGGPAGLAAARAAAASGLSVIVVDERPDWGGSLLWNERAIDDCPAPAWVAETVAALAQRDTVRLLPRTSGGSAGKPRHRRRRLGRRAVVDRAGAAGGAGHRGDRAAAGVPRQRSAGRDAGRCRAAISAAVRGAGGRARGDRDQ